MINSLGDYHTSFLSRKVSLLNSEYHSDQVVTVSYWVTISKFHGTFRGVSAVAELEVSLLGNGISMKSLVLSRQFGMMDVDVARS